MSIAASLPESFGRYRVVEELGSGAMGVVYLCVDPMLARPVAVKVLKGTEHLPPDERAQYEACLLYTSPSPRDRTRSRMPSSA